MPQTRKILVPVDGSASSLRALKLAARRQLASEDVQILVLNVQPPLPPSGYVTRSMIKDHHERMSEAALAPARKIIGRMKLRAECHAQVGDVASTIVAFARKTGCEEIIMGTRGLGRISGLVLGSVAMKVVNLAQVPVTLVK